MERYKKSEILRRYAEHPLQLRTILERVRQSKGTLTGLSEIDLAEDDLTGLTDQNHIGGLKSVRELARWAGAGQDTNVLDLGSGLGGSARALAFLFGCRVHGIEFSPKRRREAIRLTKLIGLANQVTFECNDIRTAPVQPLAFDILWGQSSWVHIPDKATFIRRWSAALKPGGRIALEESFLKAQPSSPEHRALVASLEEQWQIYLISAQEWQAALERASFKIRHTEDLTLAMEKYFGKAVQSRNRTTFQENSAALRNALQLADLGLLGYCRIIAEKA
jgi:sarcosine/dimethylglycine N-methyltransferase